MVHGVGGAPVWLGGGGRAEENQWAMGKLASGSVGAEEGRTRELHSEVGAAAVFRGGGFDSQRGEARAAVEDGFGARGH